MIIMETITPHDVRYAEISDFARNIYRKQLQVDITAKPAVFTCALEEGVPVGCFGLYRAETNAPLLIEQYIPRVFERLSGNKRVPRSQCAELGTRVVTKNHTTTSLNVSLALIATLLIYAHKQGIRKVAFTTNKRVRFLADELKIPLLEFGAPSLEKMDQTFIQNWSQFFKIAQRCYGFPIENVSGCYNTLIALEDHGIHHQSHELVA